MSMLLYACETWTLRKRTDSLMAFEMKCCRPILHKHWLQKITNIETRQRLDIKRNVVHMIVERRLKLIGHIYRMDDNRLVKDVLFGLIDGQNRRGRLSREWMDDIKEWFLVDTHAHAQHHGAGNGDELPMKHWTPVGANL